jgi:hypothetical protein
MARMRPSSISTAVSGRTWGSTQSIRFACERIVFMTRIGLTIAQWRGLRARRPCPAGQAHAPCARSSCGQTTTRNRRSGSAGISPVYPPSGSLADIRSTCRDRGRRRTGLHSAPGVKRCAPDAASTETARWSSDGHQARDRLILTVDDRVA